MKTNTFSAIVGYSGILDEKIMDINKFKDLLNEQNDWPEYYTFKFVVKTADKANLLAVLADHKITEKLSKNGNYTSISSRMYANNADEILAIYSRVKKVEGVLSL